MEASTDNEVEILSEVMVDGESTRTKELIRSLYEDIIKNMRKRPYQQSNPPKYSSYLSGGCVAVDGEFYTILTVDLVTFYVFFKPTGTTFQVLLQNVTRRSTVKQARKIIETRNDGVNNWPQVILRKTMKSAQMDDEVICIHDDIVRASFTSGPHVTTQGSVLIVDRFPILPKSLFSKRRKVFNIDNLANLHVNSVNLYLSYIENRVFYQPHQTYIVKRTSKFNVLSQDESLINIIGKSTIPHPDEYIEMCAAIRRAYLTFVARFAQPLLFLFPETSTKNVNELAYQAWMSFTNEEKELIYRGKFAFNVDTFNLLARFSTGLFQRSLLEYVYPKGQKIDPLPADKNVLFERIMKHAYDLKETMEQNPDSQPEALGNLRKIYNFILRKDNNIPTIDINET